MLSVIVVVLLASRANAIPGMPVMVASELNTAGVSATAASVGTPEVASRSVAVALTQDIKREGGSTMVLVPTSEFMMGIPGYSNESPKHGVRISAFYIDTCEVTNEQFASFLNGWGKDVDEGNRVMAGEFKCGLRKKRGKWEPQPGFEKHPVINVSWYGANQYANYFGVRLPTEAEWEMACRAGNEGKWCFGDKGKLADYAWYEVNTLRKPEAVGQKRENLFGVKDMHGNVWEWCADWYDPAAYEHSSEINPTGPEQGTARVIRGGSWNNFAGDCRSAKRDSMNPASRNDTVGFRCVVSAADLGKKADMKPQTGPPPVDEASAYAQCLQLYSSGKYDEAMGQATSIIGNNPGHWQALQLMGNCLYAKGNKDGAVEYYRKCLAVNPDNQQLRQFLSTLQPAK
jgi:formylglycine-generating enzyme required for sulfatase activity